AVGVGVSVGVDVLVDVSVKVTVIDGVTVRVDVALEVRVCVNVAVGEANQSPPTTGRTKKPVQKQRVATRANSTTSHNGFLWIPESCEEGFFLGVAGAALG